MGLSPCSSGSPLWQLVGHRSPWFPIASPYFSSDSLAAKRPTIGILYIRRQKLHYYCAHSIKGYEGYDFNWWRISKPRLFFYDQQGPKTTNIDHHNFAVRVFFSENSSETQCCQNRFFLARKDIFRRIMKIYEKRSINPHDIDSLQKKKNNTNTTINNVWRLTRRTSPYEELQENIFSSF